MHILLNNFHRQSETANSLFLGGTTLTKAVDGTKRIGPYLGAGVGVGDTMLIRDHAEPLHELAPSAVPDQSIGQENVLTQNLLQPVVEQAISFWRSAGIDQPSLEMLERVNVYIDDLSEGLLGQTTFGSSIYIDVDAGGFGWFIETTAQDHNEFTKSVNGNLYAIEGSEAFGRVDLLTTVVHEFGHVLGLTDLDLLQQPNDVMTGILKLGERRVPSLQNTLPESSDKINNQSNDIRYTGEHISESNISSPRDMSKQCQFVATIPLLESDAKFLSLLPVRQDKKAETRVEKSIHDQFTPFLFLDDNDFQTAVCDDALLLANKRKVQISDSVVDSFFAEADFFELLPELAEMNDGVENMTSPANKRS